MAENRDVNVKLKFTADAAQASGAMRALQADAKKLGQGIDEAKLKMKSDPKDKDANESLRTWAKTIATVHLLTKAVEGATKALQTMGNESLSSTQKAIKGFKDLISEIPLIGPLFNAGWNLAKEKMEGPQLREIAKQQRGMAMRGAQASAMDPMGARANEAIRAQIRAGIEAQEVPGSMDIPFAAIREGIPASMMGGDAMQAALRARAMAQRSLNVEKAMADRERRNLPAFKGVFMEAQGAAEAAQADIAGKSGLDRLQAEMKALEAMNELRRRRVEYEREIDKTREAATIQAQKEYELSKASIEVQKTKLSLLQQQADKAKSGAEQFGMMGAGEKLAVQAALEDARRSGFENLSEDRRRLLAQTGLTGDFAREQAKKSVQGDFTYQQIVGMLGQKTSAELEAEIVKMKQEITVNIDINEDQLRKTMEKIANEFFGTVIDLQKQGIEQERIRIRTQANAQKAMQELN